MKNSNHINESLNNPSSLGLVSDKTFGKLNPNIQEQIINTVSDNKKKEAGLIGKLLGVNPINVALNIAFIICFVILLFMAAILISTLFRQETDSINLLELIMPIITLSLGYIFGNGHESNK